MKRLIAAALAGVALTIGGVVTATPAGADGGPPPLLLQQRDLTGYAGHPNALLQLWMTQEGAHTFYAKVVHYGGNTGTWAWLNTEGNKWPTQVYICIELANGECDTLTRDWDGGNFAYFAEAGSLTAGYGRTIRAWGAIDFPDFYPNMKLVRHDATIRVTNV